MSELMLVGDIINSSLRMVRVAGAYDNPDPNYQRSALRYLNAILAKINGEGSLLPVFTQVNLTIDSAKKRYKVGSTADSDLITHPFGVIKFLSILADQVRYPVSISDDFAEYGQYYNKDIRARPTCAQILKYNQYSIIDFIQYPDREYILYIFGKQGIDSATMTSLIEYPDWYALYFQYAVAKHLNNEFNLSAWGPDKEKTLLELEKDLLVANYRPTLISSKPPYYSGRGFPARYPRGSR